MGTIDYLYYLTAFFLLYSFLGWVLEVVYHVISIGKVINRGFLNGPVCPIYGFGMLAVLIILHPVSDNLVLLYVGGTVFATLIELVGGFILFKLFNMRWWDYSGEPFNLGGYICLKFSLAWGFCIIFAMKAVHPLVEMNVSLLDGILGHILVLILWIIFFADFVITILTVKELNKDLREINRIAAGIRKVSDHLTEKIGEGTIEADTRIQEQRVQAALAKAELRDQAAQRKAELRDQAAQVKADLRDRRELRQAEMRSFIVELKNKRAIRSQRRLNRLIKAFPGLKHRLYDTELKELIEEYDKESA